MRRISEWEVFIIAVFVYYPAKPVDLASVCLALHLVFCIPGYVHVCVLILSFVTTLCRWQQTLTRPPFITWA